MSNESNRRTWGERVAYQLLPNPYPGSDPRFPIWGCIQEQSMKDSAAIDPEGPTDSEELEAWIMANFMPVLNKCRNALTRLPFRTAEMPEYEQQASALDLRAARWINARYPPTDRRSLISRALALHTPIDDFKQIAAIQAIRRNESELAPEIGPAASAASAGIVATNTADGNLEVDLKRMNSSTWRLTFYGREVFLPHLTGWEYIAELMRHPGQDVSAMDLRACSPTVTEAIDIGEAEEMGIKQDISSGDRDGMDVYDDQAKEDFREKFNKLKTEEQEALTFGNHDKVEEKQREIDDLTSCLASSFDRNGRSRKLGSESEKARINVTRAISRAMKESENKDHDAAIWLRQRIQTGKACKFSPAPLTK